MGGLYVQGIEESYPTDPVILDCELHKRVAEKEGQRELELHTSFPPGRFGSHRVPAVWLGSVSSEGRLVRVECWCPSAWLSPHSVPEP